MGYGRSHVVAKKEAVMKKLIALAPIAALITLFLVGCGTQPDLENASMDGGSQKESTGMPDTPGQTEKAPEPSGRECLKAKGALGAYEVGKNGVSRILWVRKNYIIIYFTGGGKTVDRDNWVNGQPGAVCLQFK